MPREKMEPAGQVCVICGRPQVFEAEEINYHVKVIGQDMVLPRALVGRCRWCRRVNYAIRAPEERPAGTEEGLESSRSSPS
jgi:hypothetical protein